MLVLATLFLCVLGALGAPHSDRLGPAIGVPAPHIHQRQSLTNVSGPVVNFTETTPVMPSTEPRASTLASAAKVGPSTAASIQTQVSANTNLSVPGGNFSRPQEGVTCELGYQS